MMRELEVAPQVKRLEKTLPPSVLGSGEAANINRKLHAHSRRFETSSVRSGFDQEPIVGGVGEV